MANYCLKEEGPHYILYRPDGSWRELEWEEMEAVEQFFVNRRYEAQVDRQVCSDEDDGSLDFTGEISREDFIDLCMDALKTEMEIYGDEHCPDISDIVFMTARENGIWRP